MPLEQPKKEMQKIWKKVDRRIAKYGEMTEDEIQQEIEKYRKEKNRTSKGKSRGTDTKRL